MVKNGCNKICGECNNDSAMSHRYHGKYTCFKCAGVHDPRPAAAVQHAKDKAITDLLHLNGFGTDLSCIDGVIQDQYYAYIYWSCGYKTDEAFYDQSWVCVYWDRGNIEEHVFAKKIKDCKENDGKDTSLSIISDIPLWEKDRLELLSQIKIENQNQIEKENKDELW